MRFFRLVLLLVVVAVLSAAVTVFAQGGARTAQTSGLFTSLVLDLGAGVVQDSGFFVAQIDLSNGVTCYALTVRSGGRQLESLGQLQGLGCVK